MGFSSACQAKTQSKVVEDVDSVAAWTSNLIFQVGRAAVAGMCGGTGGRGGGMVVVVVVGIVGGVGRRWRVGGARGGGKEGRTRPTCLYCFCSKSTTDNLVYMPDILVYVIR